MSFAQAAGVGIAAAAPALFFWPDAIGLAPALAPAAALVLFALGLWATGALPFLVTTLLLFVLATVFGSAPPRVIFAGFASSALLAGLWRAGDRPQCRPPVSVAAWPGFWSAASTGPAAGSCMAASRSGSASPFSSRRRWGGS